MLLRMVRRVLLLTVSILSGTIAGSSQSQSAGPAPMESVQDLAARLTPPQKQQFDEARRLFNTRRYAEAFTSYRQLLSQLPDDAVLSKFASEAALNAEDAAFALNILKPITQANPDDWQAAALLTRACAQTGDTSCRDSGIAHMLELHHRGITPSRMQQYLVEMDKVGENTLWIWTSLEPWGSYKIYGNGQVMDADGKIFLRETLESSDFDQPQFAKEHPKEAAVGIRIFSLDAYRETGRNSTGQRTQTHFTYKFFIGQPSYSVLREEFIHIANGKSSPVSSRSNLIVP
jgi:hypothetical protein